jgi:predicted metal-dependent peptidase
VSVKKTASKTKNWAPDPNISENELKVMRAEVLDNIIVARIGLLLRHPFFGNMATRLKIQAADDWCMTAATDGRHLYFNTQFFNAMSNTEIEFVIAHEILHCVFNHLDRRDYRDHKLYNIAADYVVNNMLMRDKIGETPRIISCYHDFKYLGWTSEDVYDDLFKQAEKNGQDFLDQLGEMLDEHLDLDGDSDKADDKDGKSSSRPKYSKDELDQIRDEILESVLIASQQGNLPGEIARIIKDFTEPKMNWRELLRQQIQSMIRNDYTFSRPNRKSQMSGAILPGMKNKDTIDVAISLDSSGSISKTMLTDFLGEVRGLMEEFDDFRISLWCIDTKVYNFQEFTPDNIDEFDEYELMGNGGNTFEENWCFMRKMDIVPKLFIMFTDGYPCPNWCAPGDETYCDTMFLLHSTDSIIAPFGLTVHYEESN